MPIAVLDETGATREQEVIIPADRSAGVLTPSPTGR
jgi:hypothetical protein